MKAGRESNRYRQSIYTGYGKYFQDAGEVFDARSAARWAKAYRWYFRGWLPGRKDAAIVELACGGGRLLYFLLALGYTDVRGVDISPDQVELARQATSNVEQADVLTWLEEKKESFDLIVALDLIEHFHKDEMLRFLDLCLAALRPGGKLILQTANADSPFGMQHRYGDISHEWAFNVNQLVRLLSRAGFSDNEPREQGPVPLGYSLASTARFFVWRVIRMGLQIWSLAETGSTPRVLTRVFLISAVRPY